ncbi:MAG: type II toxin-antitoxin system VapC family toxin [Acidobacteria bacterium]|nr:type II toxin-antitoxin system VapC family toxin [Acidobacteriota bacterium]
MRFLLDTHIWLWSLSDPHLLSHRVARELADPQNEIWLSPVSIWEILILARKGRVVLEGKPESWVREALRKAPLREASLNHEIAMRSIALHLPHWDPADRFIAATATVYDLTLVTSDERLLRCRQYSTLANR